MLNPILSPFGQALPKSLEEARALMQRRLSLPPGPERDRLFALEKAFFEKTFDAPAEPPRQGGPKRRTPATPRSRENRTPPAPQGKAPATKKDKRDFDSIAFRQDLMDLARQYARTGGHQNMSLALDGIQIGLNLLDRHGDQWFDSDGKIPKPKKPGSNPPSATPPLKVDGVIGPKTTLVGQKLTATHGRGKLKEAAALGQFQRLADLSDGNIKNLKRQTTTLLGPMFRSKNALFPDNPRRTPTVEGIALQSSLNDVVSSSLPSSGIAPLKEDGLIGPKTQKTFNDVVSTVGSNPLIDRLGANLGFFSDLF